MKYEIWKDIKDYEGLYQVSNLGRVRSLDRIVIYSNGNEVRHKGRILKAKIRKDGYSQVRLSKNDKQKDFQIHRLVALHFVDGYFEGAVVDHIIPLKDGGTNEAINLRWCTQKENCNNPKSLVRNIGNTKPRTEEQKELLREINKKVQEKYKYIIILPNGTQTDPMTKNEIKEVYKISEHLIYKLAKTKDIFKVSEFVKNKERREYLLTLEGMQIFKYEDYLKNIA